MKAGGDSFLQSGLMKEQEQEHESVLGCTSSQRSGLSSVCLSKSIAEAIAPVDCSFAARSPVPTFSRDAACVEEDSVREPQDGCGLHVCERQVCLPNAPTDQKISEPSTITCGNQSLDDEDDDVLTLSGFVKKAKALVRKKAAKTRSEQALRPSFSRAEPLDSEAAEGNCVGDFHRGITALASKEGTCEREDEGQDASDSDVPDDDSDAVITAEGCTVQGQGVGSEKLLNALDGLSENRRGVFVKNQVQISELASTSGAKRLLKSPSKPSKRAGSDDHAVKLHGKERSKKGGRRAPRQIRKRRHDDMAYEGDLEWDILMGDPGRAGDWSALLEKDRFGRCRSIGRQPSIAESFPGEVAAIAAGLKARAPGPSEKLHFKETLKRRGGLQEYLDCRCCGGDLQSDHLGSFWL